MTRKVGDVKLDIILIKDLFYNLAFLLTLTLIYTVFQNKVDKGTLDYNILLGISIGTVGIIIMTVSIQTSNGIFLDAKSILISKMKPIEWTLKKSIQRGSFFVQ